MRSNSRLSLAFAGGLSVGLLAGCQTYDFEPVTPLLVEKEDIYREVAEAPPKPNMMLLVDKSGSMDAPIENRAECGTCSGDNCNQDTCPTRWAEMRKAMRTFLTDDNGGATIARYGIAMFPEPLPEGQSGIGSCNPTNGPRLNIPQIEDEPALLAAAAKAAYLRIESITSPGTGVSDTATGGGTPTSRSLSRIGDLPQLSADDKRTDVIVLLTDGLPNCNPDNANDYKVNAAACNCQLVSGSPPMPACGFSGYEKIGCLDKDASVNVVRTLLKDKGIRTIVIGFGAETTAGDGAVVMNEMASVGGFPRRCDEDGQCGIGDSCTSQKVCGGGDKKKSGIPCTTGSECLPNELCEEAPICARKFYAAKNSAELVVALREIALVVEEGICKFALSEFPEDPRLVVVRLNGEKLERGPDTWDYQDGFIVFQGQACSTIQAGSAVEPAKVSIQVVSAG